MSNFKWGDRVWIAHGNYKGREAEVVKPNGDKIFVRVDGVPGVKAMDLSQVRSMSEPKPKAKKSYAQLKPVPSRWI